MAKTKKKLVKAGQAKQKVAAKAPARAAVKVVAKGKQKATKKVLGRAAPVKTNGSRVAARPAQRSNVPAPAAPRYRTVTPFLNIKGAAAAIDFYKAAFGATERMRMPGPGGLVMHAEIVIGDSVVLISDVMQNPETHSSLHVFVADCDAWFARAVAAGASVKMPLADQIWGDRYGQVTDPFGNSWSIATHKEDVSDAEMKKRMAALQPRPGASASES